jgi:hypothetical protein
MTTVLAFTPARAPPHLPYCWDRKSETEKMKKLFRYRVRRKGEKVVGFAPEPHYDLPSEGPHVGCLVDQIDLGWLPNRFEPTKPPRHMNRLVFLTDDIGPQGQRLYVQDDVNLVRSWRGTLIAYVRAWNHLPAKAPIPSSVTWEMEDYIGQSCGLNIVHNGTWANVDSVYALPATATPLAIPVGYVRKSATPVGAYNVQSSTTPSPVNHQPKPAQSTAQAETGQEKEEAYLPF